ncbi:hypothetical protein KVM59_03215 [Helicobacter pylori]|nr:hypothetical protein KVM59_03215 [Helicobacter pylori]
MAIRFDHNNNSEEWQMLFDKINNGSPFGVITFIGPSESLFFVYENEPSATFNLKKLLVGVSQNAL